MNTLKGLDVDDIRTMVWEWLVLEANAKQAEAVRILNEGPEEKEASIHQLMAAGRAIVVLSNKWLAGSWREVVEALPHKCRQPARYEAAR